MTRRGTLRERVQQHPAKLGKGGSVATEYPRTRYSVFLAVAAIRRAVGNPHLQRLNDPGDLRGAADLAWSECVHRWQSDRASLSTYAWPRMGGRVLDLQRTQRRHLRGTQLYAQEMLISGDTFAPSWTEPLSLRQAIERSRQEMTPAEKSILQRVYQQGGTLVEAAADCGASTDAVHRAHRRLLARLRAAAGVPEPTPRGPELAQDQGPAEQEGERELDAKGIAVSEGDAVSEGHAVSEGDAVSEGHAVSEAIASQREAGPCADGANAASAGERWDTAVPLCRRAPRVAGQQISAKAAATGRSAQSA